jgi:hypothetical protein
MNIPVKRHLKILHEEVADDQRQWWTHSHAVNLFIELASETDIWGQGMEEEPQDILLKMST